MDGSAQSQIVQEIRSDIGIDVEKYNQLDEQKYIDGIQENLKLLNPEDEMSGVVPQIEDPQIQEPEFMDVPMTEEEIAERSILLNYIEVARVHFPDKWRAMAVSDEYIENASNDQLRLIINDYKFRRDSLASFETLYQMINRGLLLAEMGLVGQGVQISGLTNRLQNDPEWNDALRSALHDQQSKVFLTPLKRLGLILATTAYTVHKENSLQKTADDKYADIPDPSDVLNKK